MVCIDRQNIKLMSARCGGWVVCVDKQNDIRNIANLYVASYVYVHMQSCTNNMYT